MQMEQEMKNQSMECAKRLKQLHERQMRELEEFDQETTKMGLDSAHIVESTQESYQYEDLDTASVHDSLLNLTTSASSSSFSMHQASTSSQGHSSQTQL